MAFTFLRLGGLLAVFFLASGTQAMPVQWFLQDVTFDDGGTATGSFYYDADTNIYDSVAISTSAAFPFGAIYSDFNIRTDSPDPSTAEDLSLELFGLHVGDDVIALGLAFDNALTNTGGTVFLIPGSVPVSPSFELYGDSCAGDPITCTFSEGRSITGGFVTTVPVPSAAWLFYSAIAWLSWIRRKVS